MLDNNEQSILAKLPKPLLVSFISDIYGIDKVLDKKIERLLLQADKPALIKKLKTSLKGLGRRRKFVDYWESREFAAELDYLKNDVMSLHFDQPQACLELIELFMTSTNNSLERCDDSDGYVGDVYRSLSEDWVAVAATCYAKEKEITLLDEQDLLSQFWIQKVKDIVQDNDYSTKDTIYLGVNQLLSDNEILTLIDDLEQQYDEVCSKIAAKEKQVIKKGKTKFTLYTQDDELNLEKFKLGYALEYLAESLGDVDLYERLYIKHQPQCLYNSQLLNKLISVFFKNKAYNKAKYYLDKYWPTDIVEEQLKKLKWLNKIYKKQGDTKSQLAVLEESFTLYPSPKSLNKILALVPASEQEAWLQKAYELAKQQNNVLVAVELLIEINKLDLASTMAVERQTEFDKYSYMTLTEFLKTLPEEAKIIKIIVYRSLLLDILDNSRKTAYGIAARYYKKLKQLDEQVTKQGLFYDGMLSHYEFVVGPLDKHSKKRSFWDKVNG